MLTAARNFSISYRPEGVTNVLHVDVHGYSVSRGLPVEQIVDGMRDPMLLERVRAWKPDAFLVAGWYHMVPRSWRSLAPAYGLHASLLPDYSGGAPLVWAIINGERETGISLFQLGDGVDDGPIVGQASTPIADDDTIATLYARIESLGADLVREHFPRLAAGTAAHVPQDESRRRLVPQRSPEDGVIDWSWTSRQVYDWVRAQTRPYPGAFSWLGDRKVSIWSVAPCDAGSGHGIPGDVLGDAPGVVVACGTGAVELRDVTIDGEAVSPSALVQQARLHGPVQFASQPAGAHAS